MTLEITETVLKTRCPKLLFRQYARYCLLALVSVLSCPPVLADVPHAPWLNKHYIEKSFYDIALRAEFREEEVPAVVKRWTRPLRVWMYSGAGDTHRQRRLLQTHFQRLASLTHLPVQFVGQRKGANVEVFFASERELKPLATREMSATAYRALQNSVCLGSIRFNRHSEITHGKVLIPVGRAEALGKLDACVIEEVTQMLGLINDSRSVKHTVFSDLTDDDELTGLDYLLIKLLYSPFLRSGMDLRQAAPLVRRQLELWEMTGELRHADRLAGSGIRLAGR